MVDQVLTGFMHLWQEMLLFTTRKETLVETCRAKVTKEGIADFEIFWYQT